MAVVINNIHTNTPQPPPPLSAPLPPSGFRRRARRRVRRVVRPPPCMRSCSGRGSGSARRTQRRGSCTQTPTPPRPDTPAQYDAMSTQSSGLTSSISRHGHMIVIRLGWVLGRTSSASCVQALPRAAAQWARLERQRGENSERLPSPMYTAPPYTWPRKPNNAPPCLSPAQKVAAEAALLLDHGLVYLRGV